MAKENRGLSKEIFLWEFILVLSYLINLIQISIEFISTSFR